MSKEALADLLREYPTWGDAALAYKDRAERAEAEVQRLKNLISEHHAAGAMDGALIGNPCPVCATVIHDTPESVGMKMAQATAAVEAMRRHLG